MFWGVDDLIRCCYTIAALMIDMIRKIDDINLHCRQVILLGDYSEMGYVVLMHLFSVIFVLRRAKLWD